MGSSNNNLATIEPWMFRSTIGNDSWYPDAFARETESALTKALQQSLFNHQQPSEFVSIPPNQPIKSSFLTDYSSTTTVSVSASGSPSGSEPETPGSKRKLGVSNAKSAAKRKSRASKRSMTTFIQADPANFRQMVQQVTGVKLEGNGQLPVNTLVKPEPLRQPFINKLQGLLPTLDTSAYLLNHQNMNTQRLPVSGSMVAPAGDEGCAGIDFYPFSTFPTLESSI